VFTYYAILRYRFLSIKFIFGRTVYILIISILPFSTFHLVYFLQNIIWGSIYEIPALISGFLYSIGFIYVLFFANTRINKLIDDKIIYSGYNPNLLTRDFIKQIGTKLEYDKIINVFIKILNKSLDPVEMVIYLIQTNQKKPQKLTNKKDNFVNQDIIQIYNSFSKSNLKLNTPYLIDELINKENFNFKKTIKKYEFSLIQISNLSENFVLCILLSTRNNEKPYTIQDIDFFENLIINFKVAIGRSLLYEQVQNFANTLEQKIDIATQKLEDQTKELQKKNSQLENASRRELDMLDIVGHELRTPATIIKSGVGYIQMLKRMKKLNNKTLTLYISKIEEAVNREIKLINTFLGATKLQGGQMQFEPTRFSLTELTKQIVKENLPRAQEKNLKLKYT